MEIAEEKGVDKIAGWREAKEDEVYSKLARHKPESIFFYNYIKGSLKWSRRRPEIETTLFCPEDPEWDGSVIVAVKGHLKSATVLWPFNDFSILLSALKGNVIIDWKSKPYVYFAIPKELFVQIEDSIRSLGVQLTNTRILHIFLMPAERARKLEVTIPEDVKISNLDQSHASTVDSAWPYARHGSLKFVEDMININHTFGLFTETGSRLVSWALQTFYGMGMLYTVPEFCRRGYGSILPKALSKAMGEDGMDAVALIIDENTSSNNMFKKIGFENIGFLIGIST